MKFTPSQIRELKKENNKWFDTLTPVPKDKWSVMITLANTNPNDFLLEVWRSRKYLVQIYEQNQSFRRLSIQSTHYDEHTHRFRDNITWDDLQRLKREAGYSTYSAVELYPPDDMIVNVANIRHLFLLKEGEHMPFMWR